MSDEIYLVEGTDTEMLFAIEDQNGVPIDLTGASAQIKGTTFTKALTIVDAVAGKVSAWVGPAELTRKDFLYHAEIIITMPDGKIFKPYDQLEFYVRGAL